MKTRYMILTQDGISVVSLPTKAEAEARVKDMVEYRADGRKYVIEKQETPETMRDIEALCGIASKDRTLTVNGKPFRVEKTDNGINLVSE